MFIKQCIRLQRLPFIPSIETPIQRLMESIEEADIIMKEIKEGVEVVEMCKKEVERLMGPLLASFFEKGLTRGPLKHYYMGLGNHWYVNRKYSADVDCLKEILSEDGLFARKKAIAYMLLDRG